MDEKLELILQQPLGVVPIGLGVLGVLAWRGALSPRALASGPDRSIGLGAMDVLVAIILFLVTGSLFQMVASAALERVTGGAGQERMSLLDAPPGVAVVLIVLGQLLTQVPPVAYLAWRASDSGRRAGTGSTAGLVRIGLLPRSPSWEVLRGLVGFLAAVPLVSTLTVLGATAGILLDRPPPQLAHDLLQLLVSPEMTPAAKAVLMLSAIVLGPALEEAIYRGLLQSSVLEMLGGRRRWLAIFTVAGFFAVMHLGAAQWHTLPALMGLGVLLGWLYERTGSLWPSILVHTLFNGFNVALALFVVGPEGADAPIPV